MRCRPRGPGPPAPLGRRIDVARPEIALKSAVGADPRVRHGHRRGDERARRRRRVLGERPRAPRACSRTSMPSFAEGGAQADVARRRSSSAPARVASRACAWVSPPPGRSPSRSSVPRGGSLDARRAGGRRSRRAAGDRRQAARGLHARRRRARSARARRSLVTRVTGSGLVGDGAVRYREVFEEAGAVVPPDDSELHVPRARLPRRPRRRLRPRRAGGASLRAGPRRRPEPTG